MKISDSNYLRIIKLGLAIATLYVLIYLFVLIDIPECFFKAYEIGRFFYSLSLSFIAASLFYFIVDFFPKRARKKALLDTVKIHITNIESVYNTILKSLNYEGDPFTVENISREDLQKIMTNTRLDYRTNENSLNRTNITIRELFENKKGIINKELSDLDKYVDLYSIELYKKLIDLKRFDIIDVLRNYENIFTLIGSSVPSLGPASDMFFEQILKFQNLKKEWKKNRGDLYL